MGLKAAPGSLFPHISCCVTITHLHVEAENVCLSALCSNSFSPDFHTGNATSEIIWVNVMDTWGPKFVADSLHQKYALLLKTTAEKN